MNTTDPLAASVHGTNPQNLVEKITRLKIYSSLYWKEFCFGLTAEALVDRAMDLKYFGGTYGGMNKPSKVREEHALCPGLPDRCCHQACLATTHLRAKSNTTSTTTAATAAAVVHVSCAQDVAAPAGKGDRD